MKKLLLYLFLFFLIALNHAAAQNAEMWTEPQNPLPRSEKVKAAEKQFFGCVRCEFLSKTEGTCPIDQIPLIRIGNYYCPQMHGFISDELTLCPEHKIRLHEMIMKYRILHPSTAPANK